MARKTAGYIINRLSKGGCSARGLAEYAGTNCNNIYFAISQLRKWGWVIRYASLGHSRGSCYYLADEYQYKMARRFDVYYLLSRDQQILAPSKEGI